MLFELLRQAFPRAASLAESLTVLNCWLGNTLRKCVTSKKAKQNQRSLISFTAQARELQLKYEKKMKMLRDDLELRRKQEIHEIEVRGYA